MKKQSEQNRAVITVLGEDKVGIVAEVTSILAEHNANIIDITQTLLEDLFSMMMLIELEELNSDFESLKKDLERVETELEVNIMLQHEKVFRYMHRV